MIRVKANMCFHRDTWSQSNAFLWTAGHATSQSSILHVEERVVRYLPNTWAHWDWQGRERASHYNKTMHKVIRSWCSSHCRTSTSTDIYSTANDPDGCLTPSLPQRFRDLFHFWDSRMFHECPRSFTPVPPQWKSAYTVSVLTLHNISSEMHSDPFFQELKCHTAGDIWYSHSVFAIIECLPNLRAY